MTRQLFVLVTTLVTVGLALSGCGTAPSTPVAYEPSAYVDPNIKPDPELASMVLEWFSLSEGVDMVYSASSVSGALPSFGYAFTENGKVLGGPNYLSDGVIVGDVVGVQPGRATRWVQGEAGGRVETEWSDPTADERTIVITMRVDTAVAGSYKVGDLVAFSTGCFCNEHPGEPIKYMRALGRSVAFLNHVGDLGLRIAEGNSLFAPVAADGSFHFYGRSRAYMDISTVDDLVRVAREQEQTRPVLVRDLGKGAYLTTAEEWYQQHPER